ncbi:hypothetical protein ACFVJ4_42310 [Streptomyces sp. NPDC127178]|uniref:hypothetical protein n=1 Tax=unclassified Streptomyces TaxID=2593676 RepID=UPI00362C3F18
MIKYLRWTRFRRTLAAVTALATVGTGMVTLGATPSTAAETVTSYKVINDCLKDISFNCTYKITHVGLAYSGRFVVVSKDPYYYNCTQDTSSRRFDFMHMVGSENSIGVEVGVEVTPAASSTSCSPASSSI